SVSSERQIVSFSFFYMLTLVSVSRSLNGVGNRPEVSYSERYIQPLRFGE
ncbi:uncharacterized, partial [Tachysurus ichikawai]